MLPAQLPAGLPQTENDREQNDGRREAMGHLEADLKGRDRILSLNLEMILVVNGHRLRIHRRPDFSVRQRKVRNRQPGMLMSHGRAKHQLAEHQKSCRQEKISQPAWSGPREPIHLKVLPPAGGKEGDGTISLVENKEEETKDASKLCFICTISSIHLSIELTDFKKEF